MKNLSRKQRNNIIIASLCAIVVLMGIGYAAFSTQLRINGTSSISSNWNVLITDITSGSIVGDASNASEPTHTNTTATFKTNLVSPGDSITYTITVANQGNIDAVLSSIDVNTGNNPAIEFTTSGIEEGDNLLQNQTDELYVTVKYSDSVTSQPAVTNSTITVTLNYEQATGGVVPTNQIVYAYHTDERTIGTSTVTDGVSDYTELSSYQEGKTYFLRYELDSSNVIQNAWACQKFPSLAEPVCVQGGSADYWVSNQTILTELSNNTTFTGAGGSCYFNSSDANCASGALYVNANSYGTANAYDDSASCNVRSDGIARCRG